MKRAVMGALFLFCADVRAQGQAPMTAAQVMARVWANGAVAADFVEQYTAKAYNATKTSDGRVVTASGALDWKYKTPPDDRVVSNGSDVCVYEASTHVLYKQSATSALFGDVGALLTGQPTTAFGYSGVSMPSALTNGYVVVAARPAAPGTTRKALVYVDAASFEVRRLVLVDPQGNRLRLDFANVQHNVSVSPTQFVIHPPAGTTFITPTATPVPLTCP